MLMTRMEWYRERERARASRLVRVRVALTPSERLGFDQKGQHVVFPAVVSTGACGDMYCVSSPECGACGP